MDEAKHNEIYQWLQKADHDLLSAVKGKIIKPDKKEISEDSEAQNGNK